MNKITGNEEKRKALLEEGRLWRFTQNANELTVIWLEKGEYTEVAKRLEVYLLEGGVYGNVKNRVAVQQQKRGGKFGYVWLRIFPPHNDMLYLYPILKKKKWLLPFCWVRRWFWILFSGRIKKSMNELKMNANVSKDEAQEMKKFLNDIGL